MTDEYVTKRECSSMHTSSKVSLTIVVTVFVGIVALTCVAIQVGFAADSRSQRNEARLSSLERLIDTGFTRVEKAVDRLSERSP